MVLTQIFADTVEVRPGRHVFVRQVSIGRATNRTAALQLVFCHGTCASQDQFSPLLASLDAKLRQGKMSCLLWDQVGCGQSPPVSDYKNGYSNEQTRADLEAVLNSYADRQTPTVLIGHSYAPNIFLPLLNAKPDILPQLKGCLLLATAVRSPHLPLPDGGHLVMKHLPVWMLRCLQRQLTESFLQRAVYHSDETALILEAARAASNQNDMAVAKAYHTNHRWVEASELQCLRSSPSPSPKQSKQQDGMHVLIVHGADDGIVPVQCAQHLQNELDNAALVVLDRASHLVMVEAPDRVAEHVFPFLVNLLG